MWLPAFERAIEGLGPWGPVAFCAALLLLEPLLVPDTLFAIAGGAAFGLWPGALYYVAATYVMCLGVQWLGAHWLRSFVVRRLESREKLRALIEVAPAGGARFTFLLRLVPISQTLLSYALGAAGVPLRDAAIGNLGMFTHMLPTLYFGAAAVHMTRMAGAGHREWEIDGVLLMLGLVACVVVSLQVTRRANAAIEAAAQRARAGQGVRSD